MISSALRSTPLLAAIAALLLIGACSSTPTEPDRRSLPIMPLKVGNRWIGWSYDVDSVGGRTNFRRDTVEIVSESVIDGETWYRTSTGFDLANRADGLWTMAGGTPKQLAKHPASVGDVFARERVEIVDESGQPVADVYMGYIVVGVGTMTTVPAGTYRANVYQVRIESLDGRPHTQSDWIYSQDTEHYVPGVGHILTERFTRSANGSWALSSGWELIEARLN